MFSKMQLTNCSRVVDKEKLCRIFFAPVFPYAGVKLVMESGKIGRWRLSNTCNMSFIRRGLKDNVRKIKRLILAGVRVLSRLFLAFIEGSMVSQVSDI